LTKTVFVTGSSNGFGNDVAKTLAALGHRVFATMRRPNDRHRDAAAELRTVGVEPLELDVTRTPSVDAAFAAVFEKTSGKLDVLINNAGVASEGLSETFTPEQVSEMFDVNVVGQQRTLRAALPRMRNNGSGLVINIGSILGRLTIPFLGLYGASKHAVEAMTES
jgi:NAD(P)-dependent dehydrogenase (short-subunit alcohol dehydrogenase family)